MEVELLVNIIILCVVAAICIIIIAIRIYLGCCRAPSIVSDIFETNDVAAPDIQVVEKDLLWVMVDKQLDKREVCSICLDGRVNVMTSCGHLFHMNCLIQWKKRMKNSCPYCKSHQLNQITFYCHHCRQSKFTYHFEPQWTYPKNHMIPKFFLTFLTSKQRLLCSQCKDTQTQNYQECITRNFSSVKGTSQKLNSNKSSRNRQLVDIEIKTPKQSREIHSSGQAIGSPNEILGPKTDDRMVIIEIDY